MKAFEHDGLLGSKLRADVGRVVFLPWQQEAQSGGVSGRVQYGVQDAVKAFMQGGENDQAETADV